MAVNLKIKKDADDFRKKHGLGSKDPINVKGLLLKLKVLAVYKPVSPNISGMAVKTDSYRFMLVNSSDTVGRQNFSALHELYHLFVQDDFGYSVCAEPVKTRIEREADQFASQLILPENGILDLMPSPELKKKRVSLGTVFEIEQYYMCSRSALLNRLRAMKLITAEQHKEFSENIISNARVYGYETGLYERGNHNLVIGDYGRLAKALYDKDVISESNFISLMRDINIEIEEDFGDSREPE
ncbi:MAG: ImmA/IrrE family metallo-endopeptidase [Syntrophaceae bacterium]